MAETVSIDGAQAALYRDAPGWDGLRTAAIGRFKCTEPGAGAALLKEIAARLKTEGIEALIGPMDGDTWHAYRVVSDSDGAPPFLMEPQSGPHDLASFTAAGFRPIAHYVSARQTLSPVADAPPPAWDLEVTAWDGEHAERIFAEVHALSTAAFARNAFYRPITLDDFLGIYMPLVPLVRPELVMLARAPDRALKGYFFAIPNYQEGPAPDTVIFKTYASLVPGTGRRLVDAAIRAATAVGYGQAIHALMHEDNLSALRSGALDAQVFRRYALMGLRLDG